MYIGKVCYKLICVDQNPMEDLARVFESIFILFQIVNHVQSLNHYHR